MKHMVRYFALAGMVACMNVPAIPQPPAPDVPLRVQVDYARFRGDEEHTYVELYYAFPHNALTYQKDTAGYKGGIELTVWVRTKDSVHFADRFMMPHTAHDLNQRPVNLISSSAMMLKEGDYSLVVIGKDVNDHSRRDSVGMTLTVKRMPTEHLALSDIEFASSIKKGKEGSPFYKNTFEVIPNVDGVFGDGSRCYYYAEAYNLKAGGDGSDLTLKTSVYNAVGRQVISRERPRKRSAESTVLVGDVEVGNLMGGTYTLMLTLEDSSKKPLTSSWKKFFVINTTLGVDSSLLRLDPSIILPVYSTLEEPELDEEFKIMRWEARDVERKQYEQLQGAEAKRKYLTEFWSRRPLGLRDQYFARVRHTNNAFPVMGREGYRTDRGRVFILYGPPDDIERHPNEAGSKPYEVWSYNNIQGGVTFVFVLKQDGGDYELVHSTHRDELQDENWARYARTN